ncbi:MAG TPA: LuxR family transcriptional regulator [Jatrophihabitans sp.]|jgi:DNA-binding CsgD family transcriptional regulator
MINLAVQAATGVPLPAEDDARAQFRTDRLQVGRDFDCRDADARSATAAPRRNPAAEIPVGGLLIGRDREWAALAAALRTGRERGVAVVIRGAAGVGKSSLIEAAVRHSEADGRAVVTAQAARCETHVKFAGLHQLLATLLDRATNLPAPLRQILCSAFAPTDASTPASLSVSTAVLALLGTATEEMPLLLVVDDAHWLDRWTAEVLGLVARRLTPLPVVLLIGLCDGTDQTLADYALPELRLKALADDDAAALVDAITDDLDPDNRSRVLTTAAGNPLALIELAAAVAAAPSRQGRGHDQLPMSERLTRAFAERAFSLAPATGAALLVASADNQATLHELLAAAQIVEPRATGTAHDLMPAVVAGLLDHDHKVVRFTHPLIPMAIYRAATPAYRQQVHAALATVVVGDPARLAWHCSGATTGADEQTAKALEAASCANQTLQPAFRLAAAERAAERTPDPTDCSRRWLHAAELAIQLGQPGRANRLLGSVDSTVCDSVMAARRRLVYESTQPHSALDLRRVQTLIDAAATAAEAGHVDTAIRLLQAVAARARWADPGADLRDRVFGAATRVKRPDDDPVMMAVIAMCDPVGHGTALERLASMTATDSLDPVVAFWLATALGATGAYERSATLLAAAVPGLRSRGQLWLLPQALAQQARIAVYAGDWTLATSAGEEAARRAGETHQPLWCAEAQLALALTAGVRGEAAVAESLVHDAEATGMAFAANALLCDVQLTRATIALAAGRFDDAFHHLRRTFDPYDPTHHRFRSAWGIGEFAEAATRVGQPAEGRAQLALAEGLAEASRSSRIRVGVLYARPLLAGDGDPSSVEVQFREGLTADLARWPTYWARLMLEYGTWLRRQRKITEARFPLRTARDAFSALGAQLWVIRAEQELRASRETRSVRPQYWTDLTEQEKQIAELTARGLTNHEIGQRLYVSHRTVGAHLYRIFPKLGVTSRTQLASVLLGQAGTLLVS